MCVSEDVTRLVTLETELVRKERLGLFGQMALALNHEINNPLMSILGSAESLLFSPVSTPPARAASRPSSRTPIESPRWQDGSARWRTST